MSKKLGWMLLIVASTLLNSKTILAQNGPLVGKEAPNLIGRTMDDKLYRLSGDKTGPKVMNFFWVECKPCREEMPELARLEKKFPKVKFISVHTKEAKPEVVAKFIEALPGAPSTIILTNGFVQESFQYVGLPHTIVLDQNNTVLANLSGFTPDNMNQLMQILSDLSQ